MHYYTCIGATALTTGFTNGVGVIWLDNVQCRGTETTLNACPHAAIGTHNCIHVEDAGVNCGGGESICLHVYCLFVYLSVCLNVCRSICSSVCVHISL